MRKPVHWTRRFRTSCFVAVAFFLSAVGSQAISQTAPVKTTTYLRDATADHLDKELATLARKELFPEEVIVILKDGSIVYRP